jgi:hypothetical protein
LHKAIFLRLLLRKESQGYLILRPGTEEMIAVAKVDMGAAKSAQIRGPLIAPRADRRTDVYRLWIDGQLL